MRQGGGHKYKYLVCRCSLLFHILKGLRNIYWCTGDEEFQNPGADNTHKNQKKERVQELKTLHWQTKENKQFYKLN